MGASRSLLLTMVLAAILLGAAAGPSASHGGTTRAGCGHRSLLQEAGKACVHVTQELHACMR